MWAGNSASFKTTTPLNMRELPIGVMLTIGSTKDIICTSEISNKHVEVRYALNENILSFL